MKFLVGLLLSTIAVCTANLRIFENLKEGLKDTIISDKSAILAGLPLQSDDIVPDFQESEVKLFFYNRTFPAESIEIIPGNVDALRSDKPVKFVIHGWLEHALRKWYHEIKDEYLKKMDCSVILVDWKVPAHKGYFNSAKHTKQVGKILASRILESKVPLHLVHLIGHSLGGQTAGFAGKTIKRATGGQKIARISALDPAGPLFERFGGEVEERLTKDDAHMVDVIHTDGGVYGFKASCGTIDFFPNGGSREQPGCKNLAVSNLEDVVSCSHSRSHEFFIEGINSKAMIATKCTNWRQYQSGLCRLQQKVSYGDDIPSDVRGNFFFKTNRDKPYGQGQS